MADLKSAKKTIKELSDLLGKNNLTEIEIEQEGLRIRVARGGTVVHAETPAPAPAPAAAAPAEPAAPAEVPAASHPGCVKSPMVGTVYTAPEPGADTFISVGDNVKKGQTLFIVEAMKVMNQITAHKDGRIKEILIADAQPIEFDQPLAVID